MEKVFSIMTIALFFGLNFVNAQATIDNFRTITEECYYNCNNDEEVCLTGTIHIVRKDNFSGFFNFRGEGVGAESGAKYIAKETYSFKLGETQGNILASVNVIGLGKVPNFKMKLLFHWTENANGEIVVDSFEIQNNCN